MEITVIDERLGDGGWWYMPRYAGYLAAATRIGEVYMHDVPSMVRNVSAKLGNDSISRLNIIDHGSPRGAQIGSDILSIETLGIHAATLSRLRGRFRRTGFVHLQHCQIGQNQELLIGLARVFGVPVYGGTGYQNAIYRVNTGDYVVCRVSGLCITPTPRP